MWGVRVGGAEILTSSCCKFQMGHSTILHPPLSIVFQSPAITRKASHCYCGTAQGGHRATCVRVHWQRDCTGSVDLMAIAWTWACTYKSFPGFSVTSYMIMWRKTHRIWLVRSTRGVLVVNSSSEGTESQLSNQQFIWTQNQIQKPTVFWSLGGTEISAGTTYQQQHSINALKLMEQKDQD